MNEIEIEQNQLNDQLLYAVKAGDSNLVKALIQKGADPNAIIESKLYENDVDILSHFRGVVPLHVAAVKGDIKTAQVLIENGADVDAAMLFTHGGKRTALYLAVEAQDLEMARLLLRYKAKVNVKVMDSYGDGCMTGNDGCTALHCAIALGNLAMATLLIEYGADINAQVKGNVLNRKGIINASNYTSLHIAAEKGDSALVQFFLKHGADTNIKGGTHRYTPPELAAKKGYSDIVNLFRDHEATKSKIDNPNAAQHQAAAQAL